MLRSLTAASTVCCLMGCSSPSSQVHEFPFAKADALATTGNLRLIIDRDRNVHDGQQHVTCSEPSPDYAIAFGQSMAANGSGSRSDGSSLSGSVSTAMTEQATAEAGRTAGVLALRDGLYTVCQSYASGVLGHDAYAMILSQYGGLVAAVAGGNGGSGTPSGATSSGGSSSGGTQINVQTGGTQGASAPKAAGGASTGGSPLQGTTLSTLLVACISEHDPSRHRDATNQLLTPHFCEEVLNRSLDVAAPRVGARARVGKRGA